MAATAAPVIPYSCFDKADADDSFNDRLGNTMPLQVKNTFIDLANNIDEEGINSESVLDAFQKRQMSEPAPSLGVFGLGARNRYAPSFDSLASEEPINDAFTFPRKTTPGLLGNIDFPSDGLGPAEASPSPSPCHVWPAGAGGDMPGNMEEMPSPAAREGLEPMRVQTSQPNLAAVAAVAKALSQQQQQQQSAEGPWAPVAAMNGKAAIPVIEELAEALQGYGLPGAAEGTAIPPAEWANTTTVMMRHIPNKYTQRMLLTEINHTGFLGTFDFLYLPIDPETNANRGYAFLNFIDSGFAWMFRMSYEGRKMNRFNSNKVVSVMPATLQGFEANYSHYASARVNRGDPSARPVFLREPKGGAFGKGVPTAPGGGGGRRGGRRRGGGSTNLDQLAAAQQTQSALFGGMGSQGYGGMEFYFGYESEVKELQADGRGFEGLTIEAAKGAVDGAVAGQTMVPKFCPHCGASIQPTFQFCPSCGEVLNLGGGAA